MVQVDRHASPTSLGSSFDDGLSGACSPGRNTGVGNHLAPRPARSSWPLRPFPAVLALLFCASSLFSPTAVGLITAITNGNLQNAVTDWNNNPSTATATWGIIADWNTAAVRSMSSTFSYSNFNDNIGGWNVASVTSMQYTFESAFRFNQNLAGWNTAAVKTMGDMFNRAAPFNQNLAGWNTASVTTMSYMFNGAAAFNQNLAGWNVLLVGALNMNDAFAGTTALAECYKRGIFDHWGATLQMTYPSWATLTLTCPASCDASAAPTNGLATPCTSSLASGSSCTPTCNAGYTLAGTRTCTAGTLTTTTATCNANSIAVAATPTLLVAAPGTMCLIF